MNILSIDPGNEKSAYCIIEKDTLKPVEIRLIENKFLLEKILKDDFDFYYDKAVIEMIASYGMAVGRTVFDTCVWIGIFKQAIEAKKDYEIKADFLYRKEEKMHICGTMKAKDTNIRVALIDRFAKHDKKLGKGTKKNPDWFYGFKKDLWAAYAVAITYAETRKG